ncbi:MAG: hypothetical protein H6581_11890 [Bacteroidia bacterium]|nr:hypothetical protein [Bacteroidia bacterium]
MTYKFCLLLTLTGLFLLNGWSDLQAQPRRQSVTRYYESGEAMAAGSMKDSVMVGEWTTYTRPGKLTSRVWYRKGLKDGPAEYFYENEQIESFGRHVKGEKQGKWNYFHPNGVRESRGNYVQGRKDKIWKYWDKSGFLIATEEYDEGELISREENPNL